MQNPANQRSNNEATQVSILTKPRRWKFQAIEIGLDLIWVWFLATAPVEEKNMLEWRVESGERVWFVLGFVFGFVHGFLGLGSGEWDGIWRK